MKQIVISSETPESKALEKVGDKSAIAVVNLILYAVISIYIFIMYIYILFL